MYLKEPALVSSILVVSFSDCYHNLHVIDLNVEIAVDRNPKTNTGIIEEFKRHAIRWFNCNVLSFFLL